MIYVNCNKLHFGCLIMASIFSTLVFLLAEQTAAEETSNPETANVESTDKTQVSPATPMDEYHRGTPRTTVEGFFGATRNGDFQTAANYLDLSSIPQDLRPTRGPELARQLKVVLERSLDIDPDGVSADPKGNTGDGLNASQEALVRLKTPQRIVSIILERMPREDGVLVWKFSKRTVANIPLLYTHFGYRPFEEHLSHFFPNVVILGWQLWQHVAFIVGVCLAYLVAYCISILIRWLVLRSDKEVGRQMATIGIGPARILLWFFLADRVLIYIGPSVTLRAILSQDLLGIIAVTWAASRMVELGHAVWVKRLTKHGQESAIPLLKPAKTFTWKCFGLAPGERIPVALAFNCPWMATVFPALVKTNTIGWTSICRFIVFLMLAVCCKQALAGTFFAQFLDPEDGAIDASQWVLESKGFIPEPSLSFRSENWYKH